MGPTIFASSADFKRLKTRANLAEWLGITDKKLRYLLYVLPEASRYESFEIAKRDGTARRIDAPCKALKSIQRTLLKALVDLSPPSGVAKGYVRGLSTYDHARLHRGKRFVILADLADFFPSITFPRVRGALMAPPLELTAEVATCVAQLCCKGGMLPQGAPTSPVLSNLICRSLDHRLLALARRYRMTVSRYADDICFSTSQSSLPSGIVQVSGTASFPGAEFKAVIEKCGFALNERKFKVRDRRTQQMITGLVVNRRVRTPRRWRRQLRVLLHLVSKYSEKKAAKIAAGWSRPSASRRGFISLPQVIRGKTNYAQFIDRVAGGTFAEALFRNYPTSRSLIPRPLGGVRFRLLAEGKTDLLHLEVALKALQRSGKFYDLSPRYRNFDGDKGDVELYKTLQRIAKSDIPELTIGVFDCDNSKLMSTLGLQPGEFERLGASVYALCLAPVPSLVGKPFCIELLYPQGQLTQITPSQRRIFLPAEFDESTGVSKDGVYRRAHPKSSAVIVSDVVTRIIDGFSSLLSKAEFAEMVHAEIAPFDSMDFSGFEGTFSAMQRIVDEHLF